MRILISEGCTHHRQCDDIGSVKLPRWIRGHTGKELRFVFYLRHRIPRRSVTVPPDRALRRLHAQSPPDALPPEMRRRTGCSHDQLRRADRPHTGYPSPCSGALSGRCRRFDRRPALSIVPVFQTQNSGTTAKKRTGRRGPAAAPPGALGDDRGRLLANEKIRVWFAHIRLSI